MTALMFVLMMAVVMNVFMGMYRRGMGMLVAIVGVGLDLMFVFMFVLILVMATHFILTSFLINFKVSGRYYIISRISRQISLFPTPKGEVM